MKSRNHPAVNSGGKYAVRLFALGSWRKVLVDDTLPIAEKSQETLGEGCLLLQTTRKGELWSMILHKALLKLSSLYQPFFYFTDLCRFPNAVEQASLFFHFLTGWTPELYPTASLTWEVLYSHIQNVDIVCSATNYTKPDHSLEEASSQESKPTKIAIIMDVFLPAEQSRVLLVKSYPEEPDPSEEFQLYGLEQQLDSEGLLSMVQKGQAFLITFEDFLSQYSHLRLYHNAENKFPFTMCINSADILALEQPFFCK